VNDRMSKAGLDLYEAAYSPEVVSQQHRRVFMT
jgi:hypothetical protein